MRRRAVCLSVSKRNEPNMDIIENMAMIWNVPVATAVFRITKEWDMAQKWEVCKNR
jgi:hypothetical protein|tara:strand:- start:669 stop:836 length:168 start_codon:yes stop_codon:yes gene_type:complete